MDVSHVIPFRTARLNRALVVLIALVLSVAWTNTPIAQAAGNTYYVSPTGSDAASGALNAPWRTISKAIRALFPGDTLYLRGGTYVERVSVPFRAATATDPVLVRNYPGERPFIKGVLWIRGANYWTFDGINVMWDAGTGTPPDTMVKLMSGHHWTFRNAELFGARSYANLFIGTTVAGEPSAWKVSGNCIHDTVGVHPPFQDHNIYVGGGVGSGTIERNTLYNAPNGKNIKIGGQAGDPGSGPIAVRNNTMYNASENVLLAWRTHDVTLERNLMGRATGKDWYPNNRGYSLNGARNVARDNLGWSAAALIHNTDSSTGIANGGGNVFGRTPSFDSIGCNGFHPRDAASRRFGRYAPAGAPVVGDWDKNGTETPGLRSATTWRLNNGFDSSPENKFAYGAVGDDALAGDWNGDGRDTGAVVRGNVWYFNDGFDGTPDFARTFGNATDIPVSADWNGDGRDTMGVIRGGTWYINDGFDSSADGAFNYGHPTDYFVVGDWNGDGRDTPGLFRNGVWYLNNGFDPYADISFSFGGATDTPVVGDWDGNGTDTPGYIRGSVWTVRNSNSSGAGNVSFSDEGWL